MSAATSEMQAGSSGAEKALRSKKLHSALFALGLLAATIGVLAALYTLVGERTAPDAYPGLNGFPKVGTLPSKTTGDLVTFVFAFLVGFLIQRSRWCNASAIRDAILFKSFRNTKPLLLAMMIITGMFTIFEAANVGTPINIVGGAFTVLGLFLFGIGMVLGGACTVSVWIRSAEGSFGALWALIYTFVGMFAFSELWNVMRWPQASYLQSSKPNLSILSFGAFNALTIRSLFGSFWGPVAVLVAGGLQVAVLALIYRKLLRVEKRSAALAAEPRHAGASATGTEPVPAGASDSHGEEVVRRAEEVVNAGVNAEHGEVISAELESLRVDQVVDCRGEMCPRPQLLTKRAVVKEMSVGQVLELIVDNPSSPQLVPTIMNDIGAVHLGTTRDEVAWHLFIRKDKDTATTSKGARAPRNR